MGRKKVPCSHYVLRWNVLLVKMMVGKLEWLSHNGIDIGNCFIHQSYKRSEGKLLRCIIFHLMTSFLCKNAIFHFSMDFQLPYEILVDIGANIILVVLKIFSFEIVSNNAKTLFKSLLRLQNLKSTLSET